MSHSTSRRQFLVRLSSVSLLPVAFPAVRSLNALAPGLASGECSAGDGSGEDDPQSRHVLLGAWQPPRSVGAVEELERSLGRQLDIVHWYQGWGEDRAAFDAQHAGAVAARGSLPLVTWEPWDYRAGRAQPQFRLGNIVAGQFDAYARAWASSLRRLGEPVFLRFAHEMNGTAYPWSIGVNGNRARDYVAAWRHLVDLFRDEGAVNVSWVWSPLVPSTDSPPLEECFPGDDYVDVVGLDGYNAGDAADWGGWLSFSEVFGPLYEQVTQLSRRPCIVAETGCAEEGGSKPLWIADAFLRELPEGFAKIEAVVWFNESREADWRLGSSEPALATARAVFRSRYFRAAA